MKKLVILLFALLALSMSVWATDVTLVTGQMSNLPFNPLGIGSDRTISVTVTNGSPTVTSANLFPPAAIGIGGFKIAIDGVAYTVQTVSSASSLTLSTNFAGSSGTSALRWYKYVLMRVYATASFRPNGESYVVQAGAPGSPGFFKQAAASIVPDGSGNDILYLPQFILPATTDATITNQAKYIFAFHRPDGSLLQLYTCGATSQLRLPPTTPTNYGDLCTYNAPGGIVPPAFTAYTKDEIDQRFPSCTAGQMLYYATTGNRQNCLTVGSGLSIAGGTITATGGGGGSGTVNNGTQYQIGYYAATGNTISSLSNWTTNAQGNFTLAPTLSSSGSPYLFTVTGPGHVGLLADTEATDINFNLNRTVQFNAGGGAFTNQRAVRIQAPTYSALSAETITNAIALDINSPSAGTNMTLSNSYALRLAPTANAHHGLLVDAPAGSSGDLARFAVGGINIVRINARNGDVNSVFGDSALATNATDGFVYFPSMAGIPSGTPTSYTGTVPLVVDTADSRIYGYIGAAWVNLSGSGGGGSGTVNSGTQYQIGYYAATGTAISSLSNWTTNAVGNFTLAPTLSSSGSPTLFTVTGPAHVSLAADTEATDVNFNLARTVQFTAGGGTFGTQRAIRMQAPTYSALSSETITNAITLDVASPTAGTNMTITNSYGLRVVPSANAHNGLFVDAPAGSTGDLLRLTVGGVNIARFVAKSGDLNSVFSDSALSTSATDGFIYSPSMAGIPSGTPTSYTGTVPFVIDTTNYRLYGYSGGWRNLSRNTDYINVVDEYGAVCDGATSAQTPIQNAVNAAQSGTRKTVLIPGDCVVTGLSVTGQVNIIGMGEGQSILRSTTNAPIINMTGDANFLGGSVQNLQIVGSTSAGTNQIGLKLDHATGALRFLVRDVRIETTGGNGLYVGNVFSSYFENIRISDTADYPLLYNAPNQPTNTFSNIYVGRVRSSAPTGFRIKAGDFTGINLNGIDNVLTGSNWMVVGKKNGVDGDLVNSPATVVLRDSNIESWTSRGILLYSSSSVELRGATTFAGDGGTAASSKMGIQFELNGDGSSFFAQNIKRSKIDDGVNFADGVSAYNNSQPIQAPGFAPIEVTGVGPQTGGGANLSTYRDTSTPANRKLARSDGRYSRNVITSSTSITQPGGSYYEVDSSGGPVTLTLEWPGWQANSQTMVVVKDVGGAAATNNITIQANSGGTVNGSSYVLQKNGEAVVLMPDGNTGAGDWRVVARHLAVIGDVSKVGAAAVTDYFPYWDSTGKLTSQGPIYRLSNSLVVLEGLLNNSNNSYDIGALSSNRFRTAYLGTSIDVGINSSVTGSLVLRNSSNANSTTIRPGAPSSALTFTLPATLPASAGCLQVDSSGNISQTGSACGSGGGMSIGGSVTSGTAGSVLFLNAGPVLAQDNSNFYFDDTNNRLSIANGTSPAVPLHVKADTSNFAIRATANAAAINVDMTSDGSVGIIGTTTNHGLDIYTNTGTAVHIDGGTARLVGINQATPGAQLDVTSTANGTVAAQISGTASATANLLNLRKGTNNRFTFSQDAILTIGLASTVAGRVTLANATNSNTTSIISGTPSSSLTFTLPATLPASAGCLQVDSSGVITQTGSACGAGGGGMSIGGAVTSGTTGSVLFVGSGPVLAQDNSNFYFDDTNNRLSIANGTSPAVPLHVKADTSNFAIRATANAAAINVDMTSDGSVGIIGTTTNHGLDIYTNTGTAVHIDGGTARLVGINQATPGAQLDVTSTANGTVAAQISGTASATANLLNVRRSTTTVFSVDAFGAVVGAPSARSSGSAGYVRFQTPADTALTASTESRGLQFGGDSSAATVTRQFSTGALTTQRENVFVHPTYGFVGSSTLTTAATVAITNAPAAGTNATITNAYAFWVQAGRAQFDGAVTISPTASLTLGTGSSATGQITLKNSTNGNNTILQPGAPSSNLTFTLPTTLPASAGCLQVDSSGTITQTGSACGSGSVTPGGSNTQVQYNNSSSFGGISGFTSDGTNVTAGSGNLRATLPRITTGINDANGNSMIAFTATASAVNYFTLANAATGGVPTITATGGDANVALRFVTAGTGVVNVPGSLVVNSTAATSNYPLQIGGASKGGAYFGVNTSSAAANDIINYASLSNAVTGAITGFSYSANATTGFNSLFANVDTATGTSNTSVKLQTGGASAGDPFIQFTVSGVTDWSIGIDNSASDALIIGPTSSPSTGTPAMSIATSGKTTFFTSTTSAASMNIPHGTAPSSPADGDHWTTTGGAFFRINGNSRTTAFLEAAQTFTAAQTISVTGSLTLGTGSSATGQITLKNSTNANNTILQPGAPSSSITFTLPATLPASAGCLEVNSTGVITQTGSACGSGGGSGTVNSGSQFQIGYYAAAGTAISGLANWTTNAQGNFTLAPSASSSGSPSLFTVTGPAHTALAADTEATDINFNLARTVQFTAGGAAFTTQRAIRMQAPTYSATSSETITNAITLDVASPTAGTNMTLTNSYAVRVAPTANAHRGLLIESGGSATGDLLVMNVGGVEIVRFDPVGGDLNSVFSDSALGTSATDGFVYFPSMAGVPLGTPTSYTGTVPLVVDTTNSRLYGYIGGAWANLSGSGGGSGTVNSGTQFQIGYYAATGTAISGLSNWTTSAQGNFTLAPTASTSGSPSLETITGPAHTTLAADTEASDVRWNLNRTVQFTGGAGAFTDQRAIRIQAPTYSASTTETITNAVTMELNSPSAGTNMTLTNSYGLRVVQSAAAHVPVAISLASSPTGDALQLINSSGTAILALTSDGYVVNGTTLSQGNYTIKNSSGSGGFELDGFSGALYFVPRGGPTAGNNFIFRTPSPGETDYITFNSSVRGIGVNVTPTTAGHFVSNSTSAGSVLAVSASGATTQTFEVQHTGSETNSVSLVNLISNNSSGTAATGFGQRTRYRLETTTTNDQTAVEQDVLWSDATHASRTARYAIRTVTGAAAAAEVFGLQGAQSYGAAQFDLGNKTGSFTIDWNNGNNQKATATGNWTTVSFSNIKVGAQYTLQVTQDATGGRTWTPPTTMKFPGGVAGNILTGTVGAIDFFVCVSADGTNLICNALFNVKNP